MSETKQMEVEIEQRAEANRIQELEVHLLQASAGAKSWRAFAVEVASALYPAASGPQLEKHLSPADLDDLTRRFRKNRKEMEALRARAEAAEGNEIRLWAEGAAVERADIIAWLRRNPGAPRGPGCITAMTPLECADAIAVHMHSMAGGI